MGMFDYVNFEMDCPNCGSKVAGFQSKDRSCLLDNIDPDLVDEFYSSCGSCSLWIELSRDGPIYKKPRDSPYTLNEAISLGFSVSPHHLKQRRANEKEIRNT